MASFTDPPIADFPDRGHRHLLEHPHNLRELVGEVVPQLAPGFDFDHAQLRRRDLMLPNWRESINDLLFEIPFRPTDAAAPLPTLVNILVEHQSKADPAMPLRTLLEATLHWTEQWRAWQDGHPKGQPLRLSPVLAIVFHTGDEAWQSYHSLADLIAPPPEFRSYVPSWEPLFYHLAQQPPSTFQQASGDWLRTMSLVRLKDLPSPEYARVYADVAHSLEPLAGRDKMRWHDLMDFMLAWSHYSRGSLEEVIRLHAIAAESHQNVALRGEIKTMSQMVQQTWADWAKAHYTAEGKALGEARGMLQACREHLRLLLEKRFGPLPATLIEHIETCDDLNRLQASFSQALDIHSLDEFQL